MGIDIAILSPEFGPIMSLAATVQRFFRCSDFEPSAVCSNAAVIHLKVFHVFRLDVLLNTCEAAASGLAYLSVPSRTAFLKLF